MTSFIDFINDPEIRADIEEWLKPTNDIFMMIKSFVKDTPLEFALSNVKENPEANKIIIQYYLTSTLSDKEIEEIIYKKNLLTRSDFPFDIGIEVYEPCVEPVLKLEVTEDES